ncbi:MAG TPA: SWIM zinc finger family protein [Pseudonocardiaceae bacterium]|nr:SWIM zinc finger family protein [Pseudonocardiaceae bacterium]
MAWSEERVLALVPDAGAAKAARTQAAATRWTGAGASPVALWGYCQGSGAKPYQVAVDVAEPGAFRCTCPSRRIPCKHAVGLLLRWSAGALPAAPVPDWVGVWLAEREARAERAAARAAGPADPVEAARAAGKRAERRAERVAAGVAELGEWLADQIRHGLSGLAANAAEPVRSAAARMVDAQAPGLASALQRAAAQVGRGRDWPGAVLSELAQVHLLLAAHARLADLPAPLADTVRSQLGFTVDTADVLATGVRVTDRWLVLGRVDQAGDYLATRRTWLRGWETGRSALVLSFAPPGRSLDGSLVPGTDVAATVAYYPGVVPLRAALVERSAEPDPPAPRPPGDPIDTALAGYAAVLAADPWCARWPMVLADLTPAVRGNGWFLADANGVALPLRSIVDHRPLLAVSAGRPLTVAGEWTAGGLRPTSCWDDERAVAL